MKTIYFYKLSVTDEFFKNWLVDLIMSQRYMVTSLKELTTKYGKKVVAELESEFDVFMPKRVSEALQ